MGRIVNLVLASMLGLGVYSCATSQERVCLLREREVKVLRGYVDKMITLGERHYAYSEEEKNKIRRELPNKTLRELEKYYYVVDKISDCPTRMHDKYQKE